MIKIALERDRTCLLGPFAVAAILIPAMVLVLGIASPTYGQQPAVAQWDVFELTLQSERSYTNPYMSVDVTAVFSGPFGIEKTVKGFWDGGTTFKVRFTPGEQGTWTYTTSSILADSGLTTSGSITVGPPGDSPGFVRIDPADPYNFIFDNGSRYFMFGTTAYEFMNNAMDDPAGMRWKSNIDFYIDHGINKMRFAIYPSNYTIRRFYMSVMKYPDSQPFWGSLENPDLNNPRIEHWQKIDEVIEYMASKGMVAHLIMFPDQRRGYGTDIQDHRYIRYIISRFAAYPNVIWCLVNEYNLTGVQGKNTVEWWSSIGEIVDLEDPWQNNNGARRPLSVHESNSYSFDFFEYQWPSHAILQYGVFDNTTDGPATHALPDEWAMFGILYNLGHDMPVVNDEYGYVGYKVRSDPARPIFDRLRNRQAMWATYIAGGYASMGSAYDEYGRNETQQKLEGPTGIFEWGLLPFSHGDPYDVEDAQGVYDDIKHLTDFFTTKGIEYWMMESRNNLLTSGNRAYTLAQPGSDYIIYDADGGSFSMILDNGPIYDVARFDPVAGIEQDLCTVSGGVQEFRAPPGTDWVFHIADSHAPPQICTLTNAYWTPVTATEGESVQLIVDGTNCDGEELTFEIREDDSFGGNNNSITQPQTFIFSGSTAAGAWTAEYYPDGTAGGPEYYFIATLMSDGSTAIDSQDNDLLSVLEDTAAPSVPLNLQTVVRSSTYISLSWNASVDNVGVQGYRIFRDGLQIATAAVTSYHDSGLVPATTYTYSIVSFDSSGNDSAESLPSGATTASLPDTASVDYYCDTDSDGFYNSSVSGSCIGGGCEPAGCQVFPGADCDDNSTAVNPGATEVWYNGVDQDCDGKNDYDQDMDGYVNADWNSQAGGTALGTDDCADGNAGIHPGADDIPYDRVDQDCSGADSADLDSDGYNAMTACADDCNDGDPAVNPGASEIWYDGVDQDCDGHNDYDQDRDGYVHSDWNNKAGGSAPGTGDCDDSDRSVNPGAPEIWYDGFDQDCDGKNDYDQDMDNYVDTAWNSQAGGTGPGTNDCNDSDSSVSPGALEIPADGIDQDCNGSDTVPCINDADQDGYGTDEGIIVRMADDGACDTGQSESPNADDCNDSNPAVRPGAPETWYDGVDQDCDGKNDYDQDMDGYVDAAWNSQAGGTAPGTDDCADGNAGIHPGAEDVAYDGIDQDCSGLDLTDTDGDGYDSPAVQGGTDCNDNDPAIFPGNPELCDLKDNNCDGTADNGLTDCYRVEYSFKAFENGIPAGWTVMDNTGTGAVWLFNDPGNTGNMTGGSGMFAIADSDHFKAIMDTELRSDLMDMTAYTGVELTFKTDFRYYSGAGDEVADVDISINGGTDWLNVWQKAGADYRGPETETLNLTGIAAGEGTVLLRFRYYGAVDDWWWQIDEVHLTATASGQCAPPVRIMKDPPLYHHFLQDAYDAAADGDIIQCQEVLISEDIFVDIDKTVTLKGGYDCTYVSNNGITALQGDTTVSSGTISVENFRLE